MYCIRVKMKKVILIFLLVIIIPMLSFAGGKKETPQETPERPAPAAGTPITADNRAAAAIVNGHRIPMDRFEKQVMAIVQQYAQQGMPVQGEQLAGLRAEVLEQLIDQELLYQTAVEKGITIPGETVDREIAGIRSQFPDQETFNEILVREGYTEAELKKDIEKSLMVEKVVMDEFAAKVIVSDADMKRFYDSNPQYFLQPEEVRASHILIQFDPSQGEAGKKNAYDKIVRIQNRLKAGEQFSDLARETSDGPSSQQGGDLDFFPRGQMVPEFEKAAFDLKTGEVSDIVETQFGYHLIRVTARNEEKVISFEEMKPNIEDHLYRLGVGDVIEDYLDQKKIEASITRPGLQQS